MSTLSLAPEKWKYIPDCNQAYSVSDYGQVRSNNRWVIGGRGKQQHIPEKILKLSTDSDGYQIVSIRFTGGNKRCMKVHRLVLLAFEGPNNAICCHEDGDTTNNRLFNLRYGTALDNANDRKRHGRVVGAKGEKNGIAKLTEEAVLAIRQLLSVKCSHVKIAKAYGVCPETIRKIAIRQTWTHV
jgi:NUMOD4 motif/HNH endonuclease